LFSIKKLFFFVLLIAIDQHPQKGLFFSVKFLRKMATDVVTFLPIVITPYNGWSDKKLVDGSDQIAKAMNKNPNFPTLDQQVQDYAVSATAFATLYARAKFRDSNVISQKNDARKTLITDSWPSALQQQ
jgi:hypothetical protein